MWNFPNQLELYSMLSIKDTAKKTTGSNGNTKETRSFGTARQSKQKHDDLNARHPLVVFIDILEAILLSMRHWKFCGSACFTPCLSTCFLGFSMIWCEDSNSLPNWMIAKWSHNRTILTHFKTCHPCADAGRMLQWKQPRNEALVDSTNSFFKNDVYQKWWYFQGTERTFLVRFFKGCKKPGNMDPSSHLLWDHRGEKTRPHVSPVLQNSVFLLEDFLVFVQGT